MLLLNMTSAELAAEYRADLPEIDADNNRFDQSAYVTKVLRKNRKTNAIGFDRVFYSKRGNKYLNVYTYRKTGESTNTKTKWNWDVYTVGLIETKKGVCAVMFYDDAQIAVVFQAHFFLRYRERFSLECDWATRKKLQLAKTVLGIIPTYIRRNLSVAWMKTKAKYGDKEHVFAPINDGVALLQWDGKKLQANTFITKSQYSKQQQDMVDMANEYKGAQAYKTELIQRLVQLMNDKDSKQ